jgi:hypothetical protein
MNYNYNTNDLFEEMNTKQLLKTLGIKSRDDGKIRIEI